MTGATVDEEPAEAAGAIASGRIRAQLARIVASDDFARSARLAQFLTFVIEEALAGRGDRLRGRVIGREVFGRGDDFDPQSDTIVRVEAGRLRRRLDQYYATLGRHDPVRIDIPKGRYTPTFEPAAAPEPRPRATVAPNRVRRPLGWLAAALLGMLVLGGAGVWLVRDPGPGASSSAQRFTANPEAYALFLETRKVSRPPSNRERVKAALELAREVVRLDPAFAGGYAAESFLLWSHVVFGHSGSPKVDGARALQLANQAVRLQPGFGWGHQSLSRARLLVGDHAGAIAAAQRAVEVQPDVAELQGNLGLVLTVAGRSHDGIEPLRAAIRLAGDDARVPYWNYLAMAYFQAGRYLEAIEALETNRRRGGPTGPHMQAIEAAAYAEIQEHRRAQAVADQIRSAPAGFRVTTWAERIFADAAARRRLLSAMARAGLGGESS